MHRTNRNTDKSGAIAVLYLVSFVVLQWLSGAYSAGFGGDTDEPAHYVTGLMVRDYIAGFFPVRPLDYAKNYYIHYPQVAFGHWPPVFHMLQAVWMLAFPVSYSSMMALMALLTAGCATALYVLARLGLTEPWALLSGLLFLALPTNLTYGSLVMAEMPLALFSTIGLIFLVRLLRDDSLPFAIAFGLTAAVAALVKPSGWALLMVPLPAALLMKAPRRIFSPRLWLGMGLAIAIALPVHAWTLKLQREGLEGRRMTFDRVSQSLMTFVGELPDLLGWVVLCLLAIGIAATIAALKRSPMPPLPAVSLVFLASVVLFHAVVPTVPDTRKLFMAIPACILFAVSGLYWICGHLPGRMGAWRFTPVLLGGLALAQPVWSDLTRPRRQPTGFETIAEFILSRPELAQRVILVSALTRDGTEEGVLVAEMASRDPHRPSHFVLRASKQLMHSTWNGLNYTSLFHDAGEMGAALNRIPVGVIVLETWPGKTLKPHEQVMSDMLEKNRSEWKPVYKWVSSAKTIEVFASTRSLETQPIRIEVDLRDKLNQVIHNTP